jgi:NitT/TauT family transport system substrate-binding protein
MRKTVGISVFFLCLLPIVSCSKSEAPKPFDKVTVQLKWIHQAQFAGLYVAQEKGYFTEENIDVEFKEGSAKIDIIGEVVSGNAQFGIVDPENIISGRVMGKNIIAIAVVFKRNPNVFISKKGSGIKRPVDFLNHKIAIPRESIIQLHAMMNWLGLDFKRIKQVPYDYKYESFLNGDVDISSGYLTGGIIRLLNAGHKLNIIRPSDYGVHLYSDTLFTTDTISNSNPDLVLRFLRATIKGWHMAVENPEEAVEITLKFAREKDRELQTKMFQAQLPLIHVGRDQIGRMRPEIWEGMHKLLLEQKVISEPVELEEVYTMKFVETIYGKKL